MGVFRIRPGVEGTASWEDERTLLFAPARPLVRGRSYRVDVDLGLLSGASAGNDYFSFSVTAAKQRVDVETLPPRVAGDGSVEVEGTVRLGDGASEAAVEAAVKTSSGVLAWNHESPLVHRFVVSGIARRPSKRASGLSIRWDASLLGGRGRGSVRVPIPGSAGFRFLGARSLGPGGKGLQLAFSDSIDPAQDLRGIVTVAGVSDLRYSVSGSLVSLYAENWPASAAVRVDPSLRSSGGRSLAQPAAATVPLVWEKPEVRFITKGRHPPHEPGARASHRNHEPVRRHS